MKIVLIRRKRKPRKHAFIEFLFLCANLLQLVTGKLLGVLNAVFQAVVNKLPWTARFSLLSGLLGILAIRLSLLGVWPYGFLLWARQWGWPVKELTQIGFARIGLMVGWTMLILGAFMVFTALAACFRKRWTLWLLKISAAGFAACSLWVYSLSIHVPVMLFNLTQGKDFVKETRNLCWIKSTGLFLPIFVLAAMFILNVVRGSVRAFYTEQDPDADQGRDLADDITENLLNHGDEPAFRFATYWSIFIHIFVILILPLLIPRGCRNLAYDMIKGSGVPAVQKVKVKKIKKKPKEELVFNPNSAISYYRPDINDSKVLEEMEQETQDTYEVTSLQGKLGAGGGKKGGWPHGAENAKFRFIRLQYSGGDWDQQMGKGADYNFLLEFNRLTGFKIAPQTEAVSINQLARFRRGKAPPFIYITGQGRIHASQREVRILREYLIEETGMLFADNGGGTFNHELRKLMRRVFPDKQWIDISNDDIIFKQPYEFPKGAPPLWHHSGFRAMGIKHNGRWVVFYHQGDINDAWQTGGSGASEALRSQAFKLGINIVYYAFCQYAAAHYE